MFQTSSLQITPEILDLIAEIDDFKGTWRVLGTQKPERLSTLRRIATIESVGSSTRIEGSKLSDPEVELLLSALAVKSFTSRDAQEVAGYAETMELIFQSWEEIPLSENHIKQLHRDLLQYSQKDDHHRGQYKTQPNNVVAFDTAGKQIAVVYETATPFATPGLMEEAVAWTSGMAQTRQLHPLLVIAIFIVLFLEIHPFQDGNGRLSRILTTLLLLRAGYTYVPYSSLESVIEQSKEGYYLALRQTQLAIRTAAPNWQPWVLFFLRALHQQMRRLAGKVETDAIVLSELPASAAQIVEYARQHGRVTLADMLRLTGASRHTLRNHFQRLLANGYLVMHGSRKGAWYTLSSMGNRRLFSSGT
jgi:Fic family protein